MTFAKQIIVGAINWDTMIFAEQFPEPGEEVRVQRIMEVPGGKRSKHCHSFISNTGANNVAIIGALGRDNIAKEHVRIFETEGIITDLLYFTEDAPSGHAYVVVDTNGRNFILTYKQANDLLSDKVISYTKTCEYINNSNIIIIVVDPPFSVAATMLSLSKTAKKITLWAPGLLSSKGVKDLEHSIKNTDYLIVNESEYKKLTGIIEPVSACKAILNNNNNNELDIKLIVTMGENGCIFATRQNIISIPAAKITTTTTDDNSRRILNTAGAGDVFIGTFAAMKILGYDDVESLISANVSGAIKATRENIRGSPALNEILEIKGNLGIKPTIIS
jgi:ribokinase